MIKQNISTNNFENIFFNACFDKNHLKNLISWILDSYGEKKTLDFLEKLKQVGFHEATQAGVSLGLEDLQIPGQKALLIKNSVVETTQVNTKNLAGSITGVEKSQQMIDLWNQLSENLRQTAVQNFRNTNPVNPVYMMAFSGARGNISQVRQLVAMRGLMADPQGAIVEFPIQSNFREGLTITEYLISCYGARKGLVDTALRTATSGYLTRRLVDAVQHVVVTVSDCKTSKGIYLSKNLESRLVGRVLGENLLLQQNQMLKKNQLISPKLAKVISNRYKKVFVRSPLTCETRQSICQLCYGADLAKGRLVNLGEAVGVIAAQSIGEPGTQLTMRTFHTGGVGVFSEQATKPIYSPLRGKVEFPEALTGHFVRTPHGNIVYMVKYSKLNPTRIVLKILPFDSTQKIFVVQEQELPAGSILLIRQHETVKAGQLVAQASQLQKSKQEMPESTHPIESPIAGEVYFEKIKIKQSDEIEVETKKEDLFEPQITTLQELGTFWIFSSFNQIESNIGNSFVQTGDLVSPESVLFNFNFKVREKVKLLKIENNFLISQSLTQLPIKTAKFQKFGYLLNIQRNFSHQKYNHFLTKRVLDKPNQEFYKTEIFKNYSVPKIFYIKNLTQCQKQLLIWFPFQILTTSLENEFSLETEVSRTRTNNFQSFLKKGKKLNCISYLSLQKNYSFSNYFTVLDYKKITTSYPFEWQNRIKNFRNQSFIFAIRKPKIKVFPKITSFYFLYNQILFQSSQGFSLKRKFSEKKIVPSKNKTFLEPKGNNLRTRDICGLQQVREKKNFFIGKSKINDFLVKTLTRTSNCIFQNINVQFVLKPTTPWLYIPSKQTYKNFGNSQKFIFLEEGKKFSNFSFTNCNVNLKFFNRNFLKIFDKKKKQVHDLKLKNFGYLINELLQEECFNLENLFSRVPIISKNIPYFYSHNEILGQQTSFKFNRVTSNSLSKNMTFYTRNERFCFQQKIHKYSRIVQQTKLKNKLSIETSFSRTTSTNSINFILISKVNEQLFLNKSELKTQWVALQCFKSDSDVKSPLYCKQLPTLFSDQNNLNINFQPKGLCRSGWGVDQQSFRVNLKIQANLQFPYIKTELKSFNFNYSCQPVRNCFSLLFYDFLAFQTHQNFIIQTFANNLIVSQKAFTNGFVKLKGTGEFRCFHKLQNDSVSSILKFNDLKTFNFFKEFNKSKKCTIGQIIRWGEEIFPNQASTKNGRIIALRDNKLIIQLGIPFLVSTRGILHVQHKDLIQKKNLLVTLKSRRLQTEDIVQGIPKIEQLFEARETQGGEIMRNNVHVLLRKAFISEYDRTFPLNLEYAISKSVSRIQRFLIKNILEAYSNQGVKISEKHVEIIVKQMTTKGRILNGGDTGLVQGEIVTLTSIQERNKKLRTLGLKEAKYEPIVLGISKSVLQSESFLLAASFQEVSRVLVRSALSRKTDFLRGLHENVMLGQLVPAGTGLLIDKQHSFVLSEKPFKDFTL